MKFIVDAHLPRAIGRLLAARGHDAVHTSDLAAGNETKDRLINQLSLDELRVVISKDSDFFYSHVLQGRPWKLLLVRTGNISTRDVTALFDRHLDDVVIALQSHTLVEIDRVMVAPLRP